MNWIHQTRSKLFNVVGMIVFSLLLLNVVTVGYTAESNPLTTILNTLENLISGSGTTTTSVATTDSTRITAIDPAPLPLPPPPPK